MKNRKIVGIALQAELLKNISELVSRFVLEQEGNEEEKKKVEAAEMMAGLLNGTYRRPDNSSPFTVKYSKLFGEIYSLSDDIKELEL
jgi:hypothetical protein